MKIKWGMMMTDGRGKLGGQVASKNRAGAYVRTKVTPVNPRTSYQSTVRQNLALISKGWDMLTEKLRQSWNSAADSGEWNRTDVFGDSRRPTGKNLFTSINLISRHATGSGILDVPQKASFPSGATSSVTANYISPTVDPVVEVVIDVSGDVTVGTRIEIQATPPVSAGRSYFENDYRSVMVTPPINAGELEMDIGAQYVEKFGAVGGDALGRKIAVRYRMVLNGQVTPWQSAVAIIETATP